MRELTNALINILEADGLTVGDGIAPDATPPYVVVYGQPDDGRTGTGSDPYADVRHSYQVTSVGQYRDQAEWAADKTRAALHAASWTVTGHSVMHIVDGPGGDVSRDPETETPSYFNSIDEYVVWTTPT
jgi:hypothetical protein